MFFYDKKLVFGCELIGWDVVFLEKG